VRGMFGTKKPAAVMSAGGEKGGMRSVWSLKQSNGFLNLNLMQIPEVNINIFEQGNFDLESGDVVSEEVKAQIKILVVELTKHVEAEAVAIANSKHIQEEIAIRKRRHGRELQLWGSGLAS